MYRILTLNQISLKGLDRFPRERYEIASEIGHPDAILVRSQQLNQSHLVPTLKAIARAGAGVNNIPLPLCSEHGIPVFNTPGANANAVKELVVAGLLLGSRGISEGMAYSQSLGHITEAKELNQIIEKEKKRFAGQELAGKTLGIVGLGAIGSLVANAALGLGMQVVGYDPGLSVDAAWRLPNQVRKMENLGSLLAKSDYITLHLPVMDSTRHLINRETLRLCANKPRLLNFAREEIVDSGAVVEALESGRLSHYITDFPHPVLIGKKGVLMMPHIGASTEEAEENCAIMAADQLIDFLEHGNIKNSVNFPELSLDRRSGYRLALVNRNIPKMLSKMTQIFADHNLNIIEMLNKSRDDLAYNLVDIETPPPPGLLEVLQQIEGVIAVRVL